MPDDSRDATSTKNPTPASTPSTPHAAVIRTPRYAFIDVEDAGKWHGHDLLWRNAFFPGDTPHEWHCFKAYNGELPVLGSLSEYAALFISGSHYDAHSTTVDWINDLAAFLNAALMQTNVQVVTVLPPGAALLAASATADVEMWAWGASPLHPHGRVLAFQSHPEMPPAMALERILPALTAAAKLDAHQAATAQHSLSETPVDSRALIAFARGFLGIPTGGDGVASPPAATLGFSIAAIDRLQPSEEAGAVLPKAGPSDSALLCGERRVRALEETAGGETSTSERGNGEGSRAGAAAEKPPPPASSRAESSVCSEASFHDLTRSRWRAQAEDAAEGLLRSAGEAVSAEASAAGLPLETLTKINDAAALEMQNTADHAHGMAVFAQAMAQKQGEAATTLAAVRSLDMKLDDVELAVDELDVLSLTLARDLGLPGP